jgi:hypothetical protein
MKYESYLYDPATVRKTVTRLRQVLQTAVDGDLRVAKAGEGLPLSRLRQRLAPPEGFEPPTPSLGNSCSIP